MICHTEKIKNGTFYKIKQISLPVKAQNKTACRPKILIGYKLFFLFMLLTML